MNSLRTEVNNLITSVFRETFDIESSDSQTDYCDLKYGHFASNIALVNSKKLGLPAVEIADRLVSILEKEDKFSRVELQNPGFINITLKDSVLLAALESYLGNIDKLIAIGDPHSTVVIDYSHPNIGKPMGVHHLLSTVIGDAIKLIYKDTGYRVIADNFIGDMGTQFGKLIYAIKNWGDMQAIDKDPVAELLKLYVKYHVEAENNKQLDDFARQEYKKIEDKDPENRALLEMVQKLSMGEMQLIYKMLGVEFDHYNGESFYEDKLKDIVDLGIQKQIFTKSEGALICQLENPEEPPALIQKSDGTSLYLTRDLARVAYWEKQWRPEVMINVVDLAQSLQMSQVYEVSSKLGLTDAKNIHVAFGRMDFKEKSMSTRKGNIILITDLIEETKNRVQSQLVSLSKSLEEDEKTVLRDVLAINSIKYNILKQNRLSNIVFDWDSMLNIEGNSAPYLAYSAVRMQSIANKHKELGQVKNSIGRPASAKLETIEVSLLLEIDKLQDIYRGAISKFQPSDIANYCYDVCRIYNNFYNNYKIVDTTATNSYRILLNDLVFEVIKQCFSSLGLKIPSKM
jgi:arginyl-tRNA synthetase